ncbi:MFS transporter [Enterocloster lavalensis]|uniref:Predicted arabinose efflux permease, MFS family n=2 Tax=Enterocloster lavalensis TaxID=460384 RepID=A0A1I0FNS2_9FIRM|nr:MFS transporter [Enterocloster lavalensis]SET60067.1 Predicted arabinose efflux permease, MFS family [Enterocloster lavalensis]
MGAEQKKRNPYLSLAAVTLAFTFTFLSRYIWSPLMADVSNEFRINATQAGLYMSAFFAGYLVTQIPGGIMADRYQPKYILIACTVLGGVMTAAMSFITNYEMGLVIRVITGISSGCVMAQCSKVVATTFEPKKRASAMGVVLASPPFGITLAQSIGAPLNQAVGWRNTFLIVAAIVVIIVALLAVFVQPIPRKTAAVPAGNPAVAQAAATKAKGQAGLLEGLVGFFTNKQQLLLGVSGFMFMFVTVGFATWTNRYAQSLGFTPVQGGMIITCYSIAGIIASCLSGSIAVKCRMSHRNFLIASLAAMGVMTVLFSMQRGYMGLIVVGCVYGAISYLPSTHYTTSAMMLAGERYTATAASTQNLLFQLASLIMPIIVGRAIDLTGSYSFVWYIFLGCSVIAAVFCLFVKNDRQP